MEVLFMPRSNQPLFGRAVKNPAELASFRKEAKFTESEWKDIHDQLPPGVRLATLMHDITVALVRNEPLEPFVRLLHDGELPVSMESAVPVLGRACCGSGCEVIPLPPGLQIVPPFSLPPGCYALIAEGASMEGSNPRTSIPDGAIVFFQPTAHPAPGSVVHVEWSDGATQYATLKKLIEKPDGSFELEPLNKDHKKLSPLDETWQVKGVRVRTLAPSVNDSLIAQARRLRAQVEGEIQSKAKHNDNHKKAA